MSDRQPSRPHAPIPESTKPWEIEFNPSDIESGLEQIEGGFRAISKPRTYLVWWLPRRDWLRHIKTSVHGERLARVVRLLGPAG
jgi:hypothetical protein